MRVFAVDSFFFGISKTTFGNEWFVADGEKWFGVCVLGGISVSHMFLYGLHT